MEVIIMRGIPGSGKTTYVEKNFPKASVCSADHYHATADGSYEYTPQKLGSAHNLCRLKFRSLLKDGVQQIVVDNTNTKVSDFEDYIAIAEAFEYAAKVITMEHPTPEEAFQKNVHMVPMAVIARMLKQFEGFDGETVISREM